MLQVEGIDVFYDDLHALHDVSLTVDRGEIVALVGANGAGKSTTLRAISGVRRLSRGSIKLEGTAIDVHPAYAVARSGVAHVPEGRRLFPEMTVMENLMMGACTPAARQRFSQTLDMVFGLFPRLGERVKQYAGTLSGGEQQMLAIGRALAMLPKLLMLDEPSLGLAPNVVQHIFEAIKRINSEGMTILLVEQNVKRALNVAHRGYVVENGRITLRGTSEQLAANEQVRKAYMGI